MFTSVFYNIHQSCYLSPVVLSAYTTAQYLSFYTGPGSVQATQSVPGGVFVPSAVAEYTAHSQHKHQKLLMSLSLTADFMGIDQQLSLLN